MPPNIYMQQYAYLTTTACNDLPFELCTQWPVSGCPFAGFSEPSFQRSKFVEKNRLDMDTDNNPQVDASLGQLELFLNLLIGKLARVPLEKLDPFIQAEIHLTAYRHHALGEVLIVLHK